MSIKKNRDDFNTVLESHKKIVYKIARTYTQNKQDRDDLIQEIVIQLWTSFDRYNPKFKYSTWIYRIALNVSISFIRKHNKRKEITTGDNAYFFEIKEESNEHNKTEAQIKKLHAFISVLKPIDKAIILLYLDEKSNIEIAEIIGITPSNVSTKINRIKKILKQKFSTNKS